jgi:hypothetical protein
MTHVLIVKHANIECVIDFIAKLATSMTLTRETIAIADNRLLNALINYLLNVS